jgi:queuine tRNA-ribosyltransferase
VWFGNIVCGIQSGMTLFHFNISAANKAARRGRVTTAHGTFETPCFMATATAATVKGMHPDSVRAAGAELAICNTYHLMLRPTAERVAALGGLHKFMNWPGPILTDSGGYQVMSLSKLRDINEQGVTFRSHLDGDAYELTPERSMQIQHLLDSSITMCFDECTPHPATHEQAAASMRMSMRWAERCKKAFQPRDGYALFGINQGSIYPDLRAESAEALKKIGFDGYGVGGLAVGEGQEDMFRMLDATMPHLPDDKPRYLMGVGRPDDIVGAVQRGIDMFDCVMPTRSGRTGQAFTRRGTVNIRNTRHLSDPRPLDETCGCPACKSYARAYIHHLFRAEEMLGPMLLTWHNLYYYQSLMRDLRRAIENKNLDAFAAAFMEEYVRGDIEALE